MPHAEEEGHEDGQRYMVEEEIGRGAMGVVLRVRDRDLDRVLAMKQEMSSSGGEGLEQSISTLAVDRQTRFVEEAYVTAQLDHPSIVPIIDFGTDGNGRSFYTMKLVEGVELGEVFRLTRLEADGWTLPRTIGVLVKVCQAVGYAHEKGVIHRDLKPANIMVGKFGEVYVMDWGLAKMAGREDVEGLETIASARAKGGGEDERLLTMDGSIIGTPSYMSPEQAGGAVSEISQLSDVYAIGSMLYELLMGHAPYHPPDSKSTPGEIVAEIGRRPPRRIHQQQSGSPLELIAICEKAMARRASERYASALALGEDLQAFLDGRVVQAYQTGALAEARKWVHRNRGFALSAAAAVFLALAGALGVALIQYNASRKISTSLERETEAKDAALHTLSESLGNSGLAAAERGADAEALLWFAKAAAVSPDPRTRLAHQTRFRTWYDRGASDVIRALDLGGEVHDIRAHPSGRYLMVLRSGIRIFDLWTESELSFTETSEQVFQGAWNPAGDKLVVSQAGQPVRLLTFPQGELLFEMPTQAKENIIALDFSADGRRLAIGGNFGFRVWNVSDQRLIAEKVHHSREAWFPIHSLRFDPWGENLAVGNLTVFEISETEGARQRFPLLDLRSGGRMWFSADGSLVGKRTAEHELTWFDARTGAISRVDHDCATPSDPSGDHGGYLCRQQDGNEVRLVDIQSGSTVATFQLDRQMRQAAFLEPTKTWAAMSGQEVTFHSLESGRMIGRLQHPPANFDRMAVSPWGDWVALAQRDGLIWICRTPDPGPSPLIARPEGILLAPRSGSNVVFSEDRKLMALAGLASIIGQVYETQVYRFPDMIPVGPVLAHQGPIMDAVFSVDGRRLITATAPIAGLPRKESMHLGEGRGGSLSIWDWEEGTRVRPPVPMPSEPRSLAVHPSRPGSVMVWCAGGHAVGLDLESGRCRGLFETAPGMKWVGNYGEIAFSPDGSLLAAWGMKEKRFHVWDVDGEVYPFPPPELDGLPRDLKFGTDPESGRLIMATVITHHGEDYPNSVRLWDAKTGEPLVRPLEAEDQLTECQFSNDFRHILIGERSGMAKIWDWKAGELAGPAFGHSSVVTCTRFVPASPWAATGHADGSFEIWDPLTGRRVAPSVRYGANELLQVAFGPDNRHLIIGAYRHDKLKTLDLAPLDAPADALDDDANLLLAELNAGMTIFQGGVLDLTEGEWLQRWRRFREQHPEYHGVPGTH